MTVIIHRVSPQVARYTPMGGREKCSFCRFYIAPKWCGHVIGPVSPMGWCKYFSQEMRQQFGGSQVVAIGPPGATLDLGFMTPGTLDSRVTFTRASTATYTDASGVIQPAAINQPRWDYAGGVLRGLLIEEARTNLALQSGNLANAAWGLYSSGAAITVTGNNSVAPDGTTTAARIVYPAVSGAGNYGFVSQSFTAATVVYTYSIWLKGSIGGERLYLMAEGSAPTTSAAVTLTTQWQRFTFNTGTLIAGTAYFDFGTDLRDGAQASTGAQTIYAWGAQVELGTFATSYIPTTAAAVTRANDGCVISPPNMGWFTAGPGSWFVEFISQTIPTTGSPRLVSYPDGTGKTPLYVSATGQVGTYDLGSVLTTANTLTRDAVSKAVSAWTPNTGRICLNGGAIASAAQLTGFLDAASVGVALFQTASAAGSSTGYIRCLRYWPRALSDSEMQQVTT